MEIDVSYETPDYSGTYAPEPANERKTKKVYPTLCIPNNLALAKSLTAGQEFTATVKCRVAEVMIRERADGDSSPAKYDYPGEGVKVELEIQSLSPQGVAVKQGSEEEDGSQALRKFFSKKGSADDDDGDE